MRPGTPEQRLGRRGWIRPSDPQLRRLCVAHLLALHYSLQVEFKCRRWPSKEMTSMFGSANTKSAWSCSDNAAARF